MFSVTHRSQILHFNSLQVSEAVELYADLARRGNWRYCSTTKLFMTHTAAKPQTIVNAADQPQWCHRLVNVSILANNIYLISTSRDWSKVQQYGCICLSVGLYARQLKNDWSCLPNLVHIRTLRHPGMAQAVIIHRLHIGHTRLTHSYLLSGTDNYVFGLSLPTDSQAHSDWMPCID